MSAMKYTIAVLGTVTNLKSPTHDLNYTKNHPFTPYPNYGMNWMILDFSIVEQLLVLASKINYSKNPTFFSKNHTRSRGVASGIICTNIHVLNVLYSILLIGAVSPKKAPRPSLPLARFWLVDGMLLTKISLDIPN